MSQHDQGRNGDHDFPCASLAASYRASHATAGDRRAAERPHSIRPMPRDADGKGERRGESKTWNTREAIAEHRAMSPEQRLRKTIALSQAALRFSRAERVDER